MTQATIEKEKCPNCGGDTLTTSIFGSICSACFWETGDDINDNEEGGVHEASNA